LKIVRSLLAVLVGFAIFWAAMYWFPSESFTAVLGITVASSVVAGYVTSLIAGFYEFPHSSTVGMLIIIYAFVSMLKQGLTRPEQFQIAIGGCGPVSTLIGAAVRVLTKKRRPA
jgi:hypothetical protein